MKRSRSLGARWSLVIVALVLSGPARAGDTATVEWGATFLTYGGGVNPGPELPIVSGEPVEIVAVFDPDAAENPATVGNPTFGLYTDALVSLEIYFVTSEVLYRFGSGGAAASQINLTNDSGIPGVTLDDQLSVSSADPLEAPMVLGADVVAASVVIAESINSVQGGGTPDLIESASALPADGIDLDSPGFLVSNAAITYDGFDPTSVIFTDVTELPEPGAGVGALAGLLVVSVLSRSGRPDRLLGSRPTRGRRASRRRR